MWPGPYTEPPESLSNWLPELRKYGPGYTLKNVCVFSANPFFSGLISTGFCSLDNM